MPGVIAGSLVTKGKTYNEILGEDKAKEKSKLLSNMLSNNNPNNIKVECPHCKLLGSKGPMVRFHFDNCNSLTKV